MSKRKRASLGKTPGTPPSNAEGDEATDDASVKDNMVHVTPDMLAGSPDIFAGKKAETSEEPEVVSEPIEEPAPVEPEPAEASTTLTPPEPEPPEPEPAAPTESPSTQPPPSVDATAYPTPARRGGSSTALGIVLVVIGLFALLIVMSGVDLTESGWPLFIILPGLTLIVVGFLWVGAVATIPGGIVTMAGVVLAYSNSTGDWPLWAYGWALVVPFGVGLGMYLQALRDRDQHALRTGRTLLFIGLMIFLIGFVLFESILGISGRDYFGPVGKAALPVLLILVGVILLVRSVQRSRKT
jgi:hypothetical protein